FSFPLPSPSSIYTLSLHDALPIFHVSFIGKQILKIDKPYAALFFSLHQVITHEQTNMSIRVLREFTSFRNEDKISHKRVGCAAEDRKSTRLNSSHVAISYAVFCLK